MRLNAQAKLGFYPAPPAAVRALAGHLRLAGPAADTALLDPCAGEGEAVAILADALGLDGPLVHAVELDVARAAAVRARLPAARVLGPCSFLSAAVSSGSFGLVYCNPPFDDELGGGGREELSFLHAATWVLAAGGVMALVLPERTAVHYRTGEVLDAWYRELACYRFPAAARPFQECAVFGRRRSRPVALEDAESVARSWRRGELPELGSDGRRWDVPATGPGPRLFAKREPTEQELVAAVEASPLHARLLAPAAPRRRNRPPLAPGDGHLSVLIAGGHLDGIVRPAGGPPHVVRGTAAKEKVLAEVAESVDGKGHTSTVEVWVDRPINVIRTAEQDGTLRTFKT